LTVAIDCGDQFRNSHAARAGDLLQTVPELIFKADARLVAMTTDRFETGDFMASPSRE